MIYYWQNSGSATLALASIRIMFVWHIYSAVDKVHLSIHFPAFGHSSDKPEVQSMADHQASLLQQPLGG